MLGRMMRSVDLTNKPKAEEEESLKQQEKETGQSVLMLS